MTRDPEREAFEGAYGQALRDYLAGGGESALARGYELGRRAEAAGVPLTELSMTHHEALREMMLRAGSEESSTVELAARFFAECLSPFELASREAKETAEAANRELESFSYSVAHDLRAPLRAIAGFSQVVLKEYADRLDEEGAKYVGYVQEAAQQLDGLIRDLLELSRLSSARLHRGQVDLSELARTVAGRLSAEYPERRVELVIAEGITARADEHLLGAVLRSLLGNAWKFTGKREKARIEVGQLEEDGRRVYFVKDNGAGFDTAHSGKLFGVFQRLHSRKEFEGNGIGLVTVHRIVGRHGGRVWAQGVAGEGASFFFTLEEPDGGKGADR